MELHILSPPGGRSGSRGQDSWEIIEDEIPNNYGEFQLCIIYLLIIISN